MSDGIIPAGSFSSVSPFDSSWKTDKINFTFTYEGTNSSPSNYNTLKTSDYGFTLDKGVLIFKALSITGILDSRYNVAIYLTANISLTGWMDMSKYFATSISNQFTLENQNCLLTENSNYKDPTFHVQLDPYYSQDYNKTANIAVNAELYFMRQD